ncbi:hypothetical protein LCGC14_2332720 [marine sediment metagenome]|uniref:Uncharacterized protein n=1 Tax=marine sediment metagenome TaxID=412755 RepID=A0A0F9CE94_9ZZZZ
MQEYEIWYLVVEKSSAMVTARMFFGEVEATNIAKARIMGAKLEAEATQLYESRGWFNVNDDALVMEVERVYATRWDCMAVPERVRRVA